MEFIVHTQTDFSLLVKKMFLYISLFISFPISTVYSQLKINIIQNGQFDYGDTNWSIINDGNSPATVEVISKSKLSGINCLEVKLGTPGDSLTGVRISQSVSLQVGRFYKVSFMAASNRNCEIQTAFTSTRKGSAVIWKSGLLEISPAPKHYGPFVFRNQIQDASRGFAFLLGGQDSSTIWLDSVVIDMTDDPAHDRDEEVTVKNLKTELENLSAHSDNEYLRLHFNSIINVISDQYNLFTYDYSTLKNALKAFTDSTVQLTPRKLSSYTSRNRPLIIAWTSPTDGKVSFGRLLLPENFKPGGTYPLYISLHGLSSTAENPIVYLANYLSPDKVINEPYEDGFLFSPWGRGNLWYEGVSETDIWEGISELEKYVKVNPLRRYITGHSMGGYGAWVISQKSPDCWAGVGVHAGALQYNNYKYVSQTIAEKLKDIPVYFVCGTYDGLLSINQQAYSLLQKSGNRNLAFATFTGGHDYLYDNVRNMYNWLKKFKKEIPADIKKETYKIPNGNNLENCFPNPFNPYTIIGWQISESSHVTLKVFDILGEEVATLVDEFKKPGKYHSPFSIQDLPIRSKNTQLPSGVYFYTLTTSSGFISKKMVLLK